MYHILKTSKFMLSVIQNPLFYMKKLCHKALLPVLLVDLLEHAVVLHSSSTLFLCNTKKIFNGLSSYHIRLVRRTKPLIFSSLQEQTGDIHKYQFYKELHIFLCTFFTYIFSPIRRSLMKSKSLFKEIVQIWEEKKISSAHIPVVTEIPVLYMKWTLKQIWFNNIVFMCLLFFFHR